jgi:hypothetical protein
MRTRCAYGGGGFRSVHISLIKADQKDTVKAVIPTKGPKVVVRPSVVHPKDSTHKHLPRRIVTRLIIDIPGLLRPFGSGSSRMDLSW